MSDIFLSVMVLTVFALIGGAWLLRQRGGSRRQALLMLVLAAVIASNVALWVWPTQSGKSLVSVGRQGPD